MTAPKTKALRAFTFCFVFRVDDCDGRSDAVSYILLENKSTDGESERIQKMSFGEGVGG